MIFSQHFSPPLSSQGGTFDIKKSYKVIATIIDTKTYIEGNSRTEGPTCYHGLIGTFTTTEPGIYGIKATYGHPGPGWNSNVATAIDGEKSENLLWVHASDWNHGADIGNAVQKSCLVMLSPGEHKLELYMDADNDGWSMINYQKYEIIQMLTL